MRKVLLFLISALLLTACDRVSEAPELSPEEQAFNESGRAKAIEDIRDLWQYYEDKAGGFAIRYPYGAPITIESNPLKELEPFETIEGEFPVTGSMQGCAVDDLEGQELTVFRRFDICDITFERRLYFYHQDQQIVITLHGDKDTLMPAAADYLTVNEEFCGPDLMWDEDGEERLYQDLAEAKGPEPIQEWYALFDDIIDTIKLIEEPDFDPKILEGRWISSDDENFMVEFLGDKLLNYYANEKVSENECRINSESLSVWVDDVMEYMILDVNEESLSLVNVLRGNTLEFHRQD